MELKPNTSEALKEAGKEFGRIALAAAIPVAIVQLQAGQLDIKQIVVVVALAVLKALDKFVHKWDRIELNGLSPF